MDNDLLFRHMQTLAESVGFKHDASISGLWRSTYALIGLRHVPRSDATSLQSSWREGVEWLEVHLESEERRGGIPDGYLVLVLPSEPAVDIRAEIQEIELDSRLCRKHVVWEESGRWDRLSQITALGLPRASAVRGAAPAPVLNAPLEMLLALVNEKSSASAAFIAIVEQSDLDPEGGEP